MIVAGVDEAGYGPLLGPLVVGCCAFEIEDAKADQEPPCIWKKLNTCVSKKRSKDGRKIHVNDSKQVYSPSAGLKELERSVLALLAASDALPADFNACLARVAAATAKELTESPWYHPAEDEPFPLSQDALSVRLIANAVRERMNATGTRCVHLAAHVATERRLNRLFHATGNKSDVLFSESARHLDHLLNHFGQRDLVIFCDRQGGRSHYGRLLRLMFEQWDLAIVAEEDGRSEYELSQNGHRVRLLFREKAETACLPVAVASMLSKYLREGLMRRFNHFWLRHAPGVQPTAGYYTDGQRFLKDIDAARKELGVQENELVRSR